MKQYQDKNGKKNFQALFYWTSECVYLTYCWMCVSSISFLFHFIHRDRTFHYADKPFTYMWVLSTQQTEEKKKKKENERIRNNNNSIRFQNLIEYYFPQHTQSFECTTNTCAVAMNRNEMPAAYSIRSPLSCLPHTLTMVRRCRCWILKM